MDATHAHNFRLKPVHSNMGFISYISSSNKTQNVDWQTSVMSLLGRKSGCCTLVPDAAKNVPGLSRRSGWKDLPCGLNPPVDIYTTLGGIGVCCPKWPRDGARDIGHSVHRLTPALHLVCHHKHTYMIYVIKSINNNIISLSYNPS